MLSNGEGSFCVHGRVGTELVMQNRPHLLITHPVIPIKYNTNLIIPYNVTCTSFVDNRDSHLFLVNDSKKFNAIAPSFKGFRQLSF